MLKILLYLKHDDRSLINVKTIIFYFFEWGFYALSASKAIFRARTYNCITYSVR